MYESLQEAVWKLPGMLTPGTLQQKTAYTTSTATVLPRDWPYKKDLHPGVSQYGAFFSFLFFVGCGLCGEVREKI